MLRDRAYRCSVRCLVSRRQAEILRKEIIKPQLISCRRGPKPKGYLSVRRGCVLPMKTEVGEWRENTAKESTREIGFHLLPDLGEIKFG